MSENKVKVPMYTLLTKGRTLAEVPRTGNHIAKIAQSAGYPIGYIPAVLSELFITPAWGLVRNTHFARGMERGWTEGRAKVIQARDAIDTIRNTEPEELYRRALAAGMTQEEIEKSSKLRVGMKISERPVWHNATEEEISEEFGRVQARSASSRFHEEMA